MKKIVLAGTSLVDIVKMINFYPPKGMLAKIGDIKKSVGGCVPNTGITLKTLNPKELDVVGISRIGNDEYGKYLKEKLSSYGLNVDNFSIDENLPTSFTDVMTLPNGERTFFCAEGANANLDEKDILPYLKDCEIFHLGYLLLLRKMDEPDKEFGTKASRLLHKVQQMGIKTSIDVVSAEGHKFSKIVKPALKYCNYVVINEIEAGEITGINLRETGKLNIDMLPKVCKAMLDLGVKDKVVIHCPEMGCVMNSSGEFTIVPSLDIPSDYIVGAVGAGDAFCAGMLYSFLTGMTDEESIKLASCVAGCNLHSADSIGGVKSLDDTLLLEKKFKRRIL